MHLIHYLLEKINIVCSWCMRIMRSNTALQVFQTGFRSSRKFQKKLLIWDLLERVQEQLVVSETVQPAAVEVGVVRNFSGMERGNSTSPDPEMHCQQMFLNAISRINSNNPNIGKDEKAMRFFCLGLRYYIILVLCLFVLWNNNWYKARASLKYRFICNL